MFFDWMYSMVSGEARVCCGLVALDSSCSTVNIEAVIVVNSTVRHCGCCMFRHRVRMVKSVERSLGATDISVMISLDQYHLEHFLLISASFAII